MTQTEPLRITHASGLHAVARELADMHRTMLRSGDDEGRLVWLSVVTLIVACSEEDDAQRAADVVADIAAQYPARALLVTARPDAAPGIDAELSLQCSATAGSGQACAEIVRLRVGGEAALHLQSVVTPLLLPDVPVHLWLAGAPNPQQALAPETLALVDRVVLDSDAYPQPQSTLRTLAATPARAGGGLPVVDLAWLRITPWRELIARAFDAPVRRQFLRGVDCVEVEAVGGQCAAALLLSGWLQSRLLAGGHSDCPQPRVSEAVGGDPHQHLHGVDIDAAASGSRMRLELRAAEGAIQTNVEIDGTQVAARHVPTEQPALTELVGAALQEPGPDPLYADAVRVAVQRG
jgi:glucose-6-phosphate dehydrogenase assembly protein OpcA